MKDVVVIGFRYSVICGKNPNDIERVYNNVARQIFNSKEYNPVLLKEIYVEDAEFVPVFNQKSFVENARNNKIIKHILGEYERFNGGAREISLRNETETIEHILPQNPGEEWGYDNYDYDSLIYRLGNLCLLEGRLNKEIENKSYMEKGIAYRQSSFLTTRTIPDNFAEWNRDTITRRQTHMGKCAKSIWKLDI